MRVKLDENIGKRGAQVLREAGFDVATVVGQGLASADDPTVLGVCAAERRCLVTLDKDFANPIAYPPGVHAGIAVIRLPGRVARGDFERALSVLVRTAKNRKIEGRLWVVEVDRVREYQAQSREGDRDRQAARGGS